MYVDTYTQIHVSLKVQNFLKFTRTNFTLTETQSYYVTH